MNDSATMWKAVAFQTQEEERFRIARALQSGPGQILANAAVEVESCLNLMDDQPQKAREGLTALLSELKGGLTDLRSLIWELQPPLLGELGLFATVQKYAEVFSKRNNIAVNLEGWDLNSERLAKTMETAIFRIVQEAMENVRDHARATRVQLKLDRAADRLTVTIADNGQGFPANGNSVASGRRLGLTAMQDRAELVGGQLQVFSEPGRGVRVILSVPLRKSARSDSRKS